MGKFFLNVVWLLAACVGTSLFLSPSVRPIATFLIVEVTVHHLLLLLLLFFSSWVGKWAAHLSAAPPPPPFSRRPRKREEEEEEAPLPTFEVVQSGEEEGVFEAFRRKISGASDLGSRGDLRLFPLDFSTIKKAGWPLREGRAAIKIAEFT